MHAQSMRTGAEILPVVWRMAGGRITDDEQMIIGRIT